MLATGFSGDTGRRTSEPDERATPTGRTIDNRNNNRDDGQSRAANPETLLRRLANPELPRVVFEASKSTSTATDETGDVPVTNTKKPNQFAMSGGLQRTSIERSKHVVDGNDQLTEIGQRLFGDARVGYLIAEINSNNVTRSVVGKDVIVDISEGQLLLLPHSFEVEDFMDNGGRGLDPANLLTFVHQRDFEESLEEQFSSMVSEPPVKPVRPQKGGANS
jgi:hypothetical protein